MYLDHGPRFGGTHRLERPRTTVTCFACGHPVAAPDGSPIVRLAHWVRHGDACRHTEYEAALRRDGRCGCLAEVHAG